MTTTATDRQKTAKENFTIPDAGERKVTLLVVEDDENISTAISEYFSRAGYNVKTVEDGRPHLKGQLTKDIEWKDSEGKVVRTATIPEYYNTGDDLYIYSRKLQTAEPPKPENRNPRK
jgi:hypothetical protein